MSPETLELIVQAPLPAVLLALALYTRGLQRQLSAVQDKRTADAQQVVGKILELVDRQNEVSTKLEQTLRSNTEQLREIQRALHHRGP